MYIIWCRKCTSQPSNISAIGPTITQTKVHDDVHKYDKGWTLSPWQCMGNI